jgi:hypothetical protein
MILYALVCTQVSHSNLSPPLSSSPSSSYPLISFTYCNAASTPPPLLHLASPSSSQPNLPSILINPSPLPRPMPNTFTSPPQTHPDFIAQRLQPANSICSYDSQRFTARYQNFTHKAPEFPSLLYHGDQILLSTIQSPSSYLTPPPSPHISSLHPNPNLAYSRPTNSIYPNPSHLHSSFHNPQSPSTPSAAFHFAY